MTLLQLVYLVYGLGNCVDDIYTEISLTTRKKKMF